MPALDHALDAIGTPLAELASALVLAVLAPVAAVVVAGILLLAAFRAAKRVVFGRRAASLAPARR